MDWFFVIEEKKHMKMDRLEMLALATSSAVFVVALVYWGIQIQGVRELLEMAYG